jgi:hypothetical protein
MENKQKQSGNSVEVNSWLIDEKSTNNKKKQILVEYPEWNDMNKTFRKNCDEKVYHAKSILEE